MTKTSSNKQEAYMPGQIVLLEIFLTAKILLFKSFCTCNFGCSLWHDFSNSVLNKLKVAYNKCIRVLFSLPFICSISEHCVAMNLPSFNEVMRKNIFSLYNRLKCSNNLIIHAFLESDCMYNYHVINY